MVRVSTRSALGVSESATTTEVVCFGNNVLAKLADGFGVCGRKEVLSDSQNMSQAEISETVAKARIVIGCFHINSFFEGGLLCAED